MAPLKVLIVGGGICGPALAHFLMRLSRPVDVTVIERTTSLRSAGQQIDLRGAGLVVMERAGLDAQARACAVPEEGMRIVDNRGREKAFFGVNKSGKGRQSFSSEVEIMRGDLVRILYEATEHRVKYLFGVTTEKMQPTADGDGVVVTFSDGSEDTFGLVVGADGQNSRTRRTVFARNGNGNGNGQLATTKDDFHFLGVYTAYFSTEPLTDLPSTAADWTIYHAGQGRLFMTRTGDARCTQFLFSVRANHPLGPKLAAVIDAAGTDMAAQKAVWAEIFADAGWLCKRAVGLMADAADFYGHGIGQVRMDRPWSKGRVVLLGDAAYCPSLFTGFGTTAAIVGAYVLAGELGKAMDEAREDGPIDVPAALAAYEKTLRPLVAKVQKLHPIVIDLFIPRTTLGIWLIRTLAWLFTKLRLSKLFEAAALGADDSKGWTLPEYPALATVGK